MSVLSWLTFPQVRAMSASLFTETVIGDKSRCFLLNRWTVLDYSSSKSQESVRLAQHAALFACVLFFVSNLLFRFQEAGLHGIHQRFVLPSVLLCSFLLQGMLLETILVAFSCLSQHQRSFVWVSWELRGSSFCRLIHDFHVKASVRLAIYPFMWVQICTCFPCRSLKLHPCLHAGGYCPVTWPIVLSPTEKVVVMWSLPTDHQGVIALLPPFLWLLSCLFFHLLFWFDSNCRISCGQHSPFVPPGLVMKQRIQYVIWIHLTIARGLGLSPCIILGPKFDWQRKYENVHGFGLP